MVLWLIGLGLGDEKDITVRGLEAVKSCKYIYLEHYTAILGVDKEKLEKFYGKDIILADREFVEQSAQEMLKLAKTDDVAFLVVGDPFAATTHHDLVLRASEQGIKCEVVHNASIMNAVAQCGLQLYQFGQTVSICFFRDDWRPDSFYDKIKANMVNKFHTLCLLDIKVKEQSFENMMKNIKIYEPPRYMTINCCIEQLLEIEEKRNEHVYSRDTPAFGIARLGQPDQQIVSGTLSELLNIDFGGPLHSLVIASEMHFIEQDMYDFYHWDRARREAEKQKKRLEEEENMRLEAAQRAEQRRREKEQQLLQQKKLQQAQQEASEAAQSSHAAHVQALQARVKAGQLSAGAGVNSMSSSVVAAASVVSGNTTQEDTDDEELANVEPSLF